MKIEKNEGDADRIVRAFIIAGLFLFGFLFAQGNLKIFCLGFGLLMTLTTALGWCPAYIIFGINTCGKKKSGEV